MSFAHLTFIQVSYPRRLFSCQHSVGRSVASVCLHSKRKTAWAISTKVHRQKVHGRTSACTNPEGQKVEGQILTLTLGLEKYATSAYLLVVYIYPEVKNWKYNVTGLSGVNRYNQNFHLPGVCLHVDMTAHFSSCHYYHRQLKSTLSLSFL